MGRKLRTRFDLWLPDLQMSVEKKQWKQKQCHDKKKPVREFQTGQKVYAEDFASKSERWISGVIQEVTGPVSYKIRLEDGRVIRRHVDNVRSRDSAISQTSTSVEEAGIVIDAATEQNLSTDNEFSVVSFNPTQPESTTSTPPPESTQSLPADVGMTSSVNENSNSERSSEVLPASIEPTIEPSASAGNQSISSRRSARVRSPPDRYGFEKNKLRRGKCCDLCNELYCV